MKIPAFLQHRFHWINLPGAILMVLLQRMPALNPVAVADEMAIASSVGVVLKSVVAAVAALGAVNTMVGATPLSPSEGTASGITVTVGSSVSVFYTVTGTQTPPMSWTVSGSIPPGLNFSGLTAPGFVNVETLHLQGTPTTAGTYNLTLRAFRFTGGMGSNPDDQSPSYPYTITVTGSSGNTAPSFTTQPASQTVTAGGSVTFTAAASGTPTPTYQWRKDGVNLGGATNTSFNIASVVTGDAGSYTVVATNSAGSVTSNAATLTVNAATNAPSFTTQPASQSATVGDSVTFTAAANGTPTPTYQWRKDGVNISGATNTSFNIASVVTGDAGSYTVVATNSAGSATSNAATLTVNAAAVAPTITTQPASQTVTSGSSVTFTAAASGSPTPTLQWKKDGVNLGGATSASLTITNVASGNAGSYTITATNSAGSVTSNAATLGVLSGRLTDETVTTGHGVTLSAANASGSIQWQVSADGGSTWTNLSNGGPYGGVTTSSLMISNADSTLNGLQYRFVATDNGTVSTSAPATLTVAQAFLPFPTSIAADGSGNLFVGDANLNTIQKITSASQISLVAGTSGTSGSSDGDGSAARFNQPNGLTLLANGTIIVSDTSNATIRSITTGGTVTTLAGSSSNRGNADGAGSAATFSAPVGIARDANGVLYVADSMNHTIRKITGDGTVSTIAGSAGASGFADGAGASARFNDPTGIAVDGGGAIYVADTTNNLIRKIAADGTVTTLAGVQNVAGYDDGTGSGALFNHPGGLAVDGSGNLYLADTDNSTIRKITPAGVVTTLAGLATIAGLADGDGQYALFNHPQSLTLDSSGNIYVADTGNATVRKISPGGNVSTLTLNNVTAPVFTTQPASRTVTAGSSVTFTAAASGSPTYQWRKDGANISGATSASFSIGSAVAGDAGSYSVVATNSAGSATSNAATLTVEAAPPPPSSGGGGGGGGAPTLWFFAALSLLGLGRRLFRPRH